MNIKAEQKCKVDLFHGGSRNLKPGEEADASDNERTAFLIKRGLVSKLAKRGRPKAAEVENQDPGQEVENADPKTSRKRAASKPKE